MRDPLSRSERSARMARIRSKGNASTEKAVASTLRSEGITGWIKHPTELEGNPDFYFTRHRLVGFVDGCFLHGGPRCGRVPKSRVAFWRAKNAGNRRRGR